MSNERTGLYEGMFLFPQSATANLQAAVDHLKMLLDKSGATIITMKKWDERRLAYEVNGNKRGVYFLVYFNAPTQTISDLERRCNQSEELLRMMVTRAEHVPQELIDANEGSQDLASEIKLKESQSSEGSSNKTASISRKEDEVAGEAPPKEEVAEEVPAEAIEEAVTEANAEETAQEATETS